MPRTELRSSAVRWIDLEKPNEVGLAQLAEEFHFHPLDIADCRKTSQRPKVERYADYVFLVFMIPLYNRKTREIESGEVDFFIGNGYVVTVFESALPPLMEFKRQFENDESLRNDCGTSSVRLLNEMLDRLVVSLYPMLDHISLDIHTAEKRIFSKRDSKLVEEIAQLRRNVTDYRRIVQSHKNTLKRLVDILRLNHIEGSIDAVPSFERTIDRMKEVWDLLESYRESTETLYETNESLASFKLNEIMRTFTTMSVMIFFMTLIASLFAVRARGTPLLNVPFAFWLLVAIIVMSGFAARQFFKKRRLLE